MIGKKVIRIEVEFPTPVLLHAIATASLDHPLQRGMAVSDLT